MHSGNAVCDTPIGITSWSPAVKWNGSKSWCNVGAEGVTSHAISKRTELGIRSEDMRKGDNEQRCSTDRSIAMDPERFPFICTSAVRDRYRMYNHLMNSGSNSAVFKTATKIRWSTLSNALDWSKLISAASVSSSIPSRISRTKYRFFFFINLIFTA